MTGQKQVCVEVDGSIAIETDVARAYDCEVELQMKCSATDDHREDVRAFMGRRKPEFTGR